MGEFSPLHWLLVVIIFLLLFGPSKLASITKGLGKGLGDGIRNFKSAMNEETTGDKKKEETSTEEKKS